MRITSKEIIPLLRESIEGDRLPFYLSFGEAIVTELDNKDASLERIRKVIVEQMKEIEKREAGDLRQNLRSVLARSAGLPMSASEEVIEAAIENNARDHSEKIAKLRGLEVLSDEEFQERFPLPAA